MVLKKYYTRPTNDTAELSIVKPEEQVGSVDVNLEKWPEQFSYFGFIKETYYNCTYEGIPEEIKKEKSPINDDTVFYLTKKSQFTHLGKICRFHHHTLLVSFIMLWKVW